MDSDSPAEAPFPLLKEIERFHREFLTLSSVLTEKLEGLGQESSALRARLEELERMHVRLLEACRSRTLSRCADDWSFVLLQETFRSLTGLVVSDMERVKELSNRL